MEIYVGILFITLATILGSILENSRRFSLEGNSLTNSQDVKILYEVFNFHLPLCLGIIGLAWDRQFPNYVIAVLVILLMFGIATKAAFSKHQPDRMSYKDRDFLMGVILPNACGFSSVLVILIINLWKYWGVIL